MSDDPETPETTGIRIKLTPDFIDSAARAAHGMLWTQIGGTTTPPPPQQSWDGTRENVREAWRFAVREAIGVTLLELQDKGYLREGVRV